ncbi:MAG: DisA protein [Deltaproteobacteria bacterium]|nr:DisA protein [Deltaproteobacteria bacterium]
MENLYIFFSSLRWQDILDITLNSYILFRLYILFRGTSTLRVIMGLVMLWLFQRTALAMGLIVTSWLMQGITAAAAIIIIVVFGNEIRNVFQAKNFLSIFWRIHHPPELYALDEITKGIFDLAKNRIGALLVFPGKKDPTDFIRGGIDWDGVVSKEMIKSIFWHNNPVHDGAAVIDGKRISRVACILPLSHRLGIPSYYGTRHRAAAGLAEATDALVAVVSEERGEVTVARGDSMRIIRSPKQLEEFIRAHTGQTIKTDNHVVKENVKIAGAALASVILVSMIWFGFTRGMDTLVSLDVPIKFAELPPEMEIVNASAGSVNVNLAGAATLIQSLRPDQVQVKVGLLNAHVGDNSFKIKTADISSPPGIHVNRIQPESVTVTIDMEATRSIPVQADFSGRLSEGLRVTGVDVKPAFIKVTGRSLAIARTSTIYTQKIPVDTITKSGQITVKPAFENGLEPASGTGGDTITVEYTVMPKNPVK